jgi:hypothetical protein
MALLPLVFGPDSADSTGFAGNSSVELFFTAAAEKYGLDFGIGISPFGDNAFGSQGTPALSTNFGGYGTDLWIKPWSFLHIKAGFFADGFFGGKVFASPFWLTGYMTDSLTGSIVFSSLDGSSGIENGTTPHATFTITPPVEGLRLAVSVPFVQYAPPTTKDNIKDTYKRTQVALGYDIPNIGFIRAQFVGGVTGPNNDSANRIEAAFNLTAVENLILGVGGKIPLGDEGKAVLGADFSLGLEAQYTAGPFTAATLVQLKQPTASGADLGIIVNPWIGYSFQGIADVGVDANIYTAGGPAGDEFGTSLGAYVRLPVVPFLAACTLAVTYDTLSEVVAIPLTLAVYF